MKKTYLIALFFSGLFLSVSSAQTVGTATISPFSTNANPTIIRKSNNPFQVSYTVSQPVVLLIGGMAVTVNLPNTLCNNAQATPTATTSGATTNNIFVGLSGDMSTGFFNIQVDKSTPVGTNFQILYTVYYVDFNTGLCTSTSTVGFYTVVEDLPIELVSFNAKLENSAAAQLQWVTASELNNDFFGVERSTDGKHFDQLGQIKGAGTSTAINNYAFEDLNLPNNSSVAYYRLKSVDLTGKADYSKVVAINLGKSKNFNVVNILNSPDKSVVQYETPADGDLTVSIFNLNGQAVQQFKTTAVKGYNEINVDKNTLSSGVYMVNVNNGAQSLNAKIVKF